MQAFTPSLVQSFTSLAVRVVDRRRRQWRGIHARQAYHTVCTCTHLEAPPGCAHRALALARTFSSY